VRVLKGGLKLSVLRVPFLAKKKIRNVKLAGNSVDFTQAGGDVLFAQPVIISEGADIALKC